MRGSSVRNESYKPVARGTQKDRFMFRASGVGVSNCREYSLFHVGLGQSKFNTFGFKKRYHTCSSREIQPSSISIPICIEWRNFTEPDSIQPRLRPFPTPDNPSPSPFRWSLQLKSLIQRVSRFIRRVGRDQSCQDRKSFNSPFSRT
jgi:hypothetical protein